MSGLGKILRASSQLATHIELVHALTSSHAGVMTGQDGERVGTARNMASGGHCT